MRNKAELPPERLNRAGEDYLKAILILQRRNGSVRSLDIALFGSYGRGDGERMRNWEDDCRACGIQLACESVTVNGFPEGAVAEVCRELGKAPV